MKILMVLVLSSFIGSAFADCRQAYVDQIKVIDGRMNPGRTTVIANAVGSLGVPLTAAAMGITIAPAALIATPVIGLGAGSFLFILSQHKRSLQKAQRLLEEADKGTGPMLARFYRQVGAADESLQSKLRDDLIHANARNEFCAPKGMLSKPNLSGYGELKRRERKFLVSLVPGSSLADAKVSEDASEE